MLVMARPRLPSETVTELGDSDGEAGDSWHDQDEDSSEHGLSLNHKMNGQVPGIRDSLDMEGSISARNRRREKLVRISHCVMVI